MNGTNENQKTRKPARTAKAHTGIKRGKNERTCTKCLIVKPYSEFRKCAKGFNGYRSQCSMCDWKEEKAYREKNPRKKRKRNKDNGCQKEKARNTFKKHKWKYGIAPRPCVICGSTEKTVAHHEDYSKPFSVVWLCFEHHNGYHAAKRRKTADLEKYSSIITKEFLISDNEIMKQKCGTCKHWKKLTTGNPRRNHGKCNALKGVKLPRWATGNITIEKNDDQCDCYERRTP